MSARRGGDSGSAGGGGLFIVLILAVWATVGLEWAQKHFWWAILISFLAGIFLLLLVIRKLAGAALKSPFLWGLLSFFVGYKVAKKLNERDEPPAKSGAKPGVKTAEAEGGDGITLGEALRSQGFTTKEIREVKSHIEQNFADESLEEQIRESFAYLGRK